MPVWLAAKYQLPQQAVWQIDHMRQDNVCQARVMAYASQLRVVYRARLSIGHDSGARPAREHETSNTRPKISYSLEQCFASRVP